jgi:cytoskeletal protein CcmA (bactofilin family)
MVTDSVPGDVMLAGNEIAFSGAAGGDYLAAAGDQRISGHIQGSARIAAGNAVLTATIERNATLVSGNLVIAREGVLQGNAYAAAGNIVMRGTIRGFAQLIAGAVRIDGTVGSDVSVSADRLDIGPDARIEGDLRYRVPPESVTIDSAAVITGSVVALPVRSLAGVWLVLRALAGLGFLLAGMVLVGIFPSVAATAADRLRAHPLPSMALGVGWLVLVPPLIVLVTVTVIGIPIALLLLAAYVLVLYTSGIVAGLSIGRALTGAWALGGRGRLVLAFLAGGLLLLLASLVPVLGGLVVLVAILLGAGALIWPLGSRTRSTQPS